MRKVLRILILGTSFFKNLGNIDFIFRVHMGHEKPEKPEKQVTFVKSHENFKKLTKFMKVVMKKRKSTVNAVF